MSAEIDFYFDFSSPYGFIASTLIDDLAAKHGRQVVWHPFLIGAVYKEHGGVPLEHPLKRDYALKDFIRTGRFNGITPSFFATMTIRPPGIIDRPHRHVSSSINYYFAGSGFSVVEGQRYRWKAGDLQVSAPGWAVHNHASDEGEPVYELTVQDQPLTIYMEALLWQESMKGPKTILGTHTGFTTNRRQTQDR